MKSIKFNGATLEIGKGQPEYSVLHAREVELEGIPRLLMCFELNDEEIEEITRTRKVWYSRLIFSGECRACASKQPFLPMQLSVFPLVEDVGDVSGVADESARKFFLSLAVKANEIAGVPVAVVTLIEKTSDAKDLHGIRLNGMRRLSWKVSDELAGDMVLDGLDGAGANEFANQIKKAGIKNFALSVVQLEREEDKYGIIWKLAMYYTPNS